MSDAPADLDKLDPQEVADETGVDLDDVREVLAFLTPNWLFARYVVEEEQEEIRDRRFQQVQDGGDR